MAPPGGGTSKRLGRSKTVWSLTGGAVWRRHVFCPQLYVNSVADFFFSRAGRINWSTAAILSGKGPFSHYYSKSWTIDPRILTFRWLVVFLTEPRCSSTFRCAVRTSTAGSVISPARAATTTTPATPWPVFPLLSTISWRIMTRMKTCMDRGKIVLEKVHPAFNLTLDCLLTARLFFREKI